MLGILVFCFLLLDRFMLFTGSSRVQVPGPSSRRRIELGTRGFVPRAAAAGESKGGGGDCRICLAAGDLWVRVSGGQRQEYAGHVGGFSHESEHDLAVMVSDFLENGSGGGQSRCSSDSDSGVPDINHLAKEILVSRFSASLFAEFSCRGIFVLIRFPFTAV